MRLVVLILCLSALGTARASEMRFPPPDFESGYAMPQTEFPAATESRHMTWGVVTYAAALACAAWLVLRRRSRAGMVLLGVAALVWFGFLREGCLCPIGAVQNVSLAIADARYAVPVAGALLFLLPLAFALAFGRVFCGGVCPLGAAQDLVLIRPVRVPTWLEHALGVVPPIYLGVAVLLAATDSWFIICRYDPFVAFFRRSGSFGMLFLGGAFLLVGMFVGRPYCRFLCPYGALLGMVSHRAGVEENEVGALRPVQLLHARFPEQIIQHLGIVEVHLASVGFQVIGLHALGLPFPMILPSRISLSASRTSTRARAPRSRPGASKRSCW